MESALRHGPRPHTVFQVRSCPRLQWEAEAGQLALAAGQMAATAVLLLAAVGHERAKAQPVVRGSNRQRRGTTPPPQLLDDGATLDRVQR